MSSVPYIPDNAPFSESQRAWLNGFLAGLFSQAPGEAGGAAQAELNATSATIVYGSQTGNAETLSKQAAKRLTAAGVKSSVCEMDSFDLEQLPDTENLLVITSTYGEGEPPDNAQAFVEALQGEAAPRLENTRFAVFGLGDTNYPDFNECAKVLQARLTTLGGRELLTPVYSDVDFEAPFEAWLGSVIDAVKAGGARALAGNAILVSEPEVEPAEAARKYTRKNPFKARIVGNANLNGAGSAKETRHVELSLEGSGISYEPGDALGVWPRNCSALVDEVIERVGFDGEEAVTTPDGQEVSLRHALQNFYDISQLSEQFLAEYAKLLAQPDLVLAGSNGSSDPKLYREGRQIIDTLCDFPGRIEEPQAFISLLKPLAPRLYSIASSPQAHRGEVHLTVGVVRYETHGRLRKGVCSSFLADAAEGEEVPVYIQPNRSFRPPEDPATPLIMVGPGTGIAPFRAFLETREAAGGGGKNWLFFGDQKKQCDFLYQTQLETWLSTGVLNRLDTAFSRDQAQKVYVQDRMRAHGAALFAWLEEGAHFCVCGDASRMAKDVDQALRGLVAEHGGRSEQAATDYVDALKKQKRYLRDVY